MWAEFNAFRKETEAKFTHLEAQLQENDKTIADLKNQNVENRSRMIEAKKDHEETKAIIGQLTQQFAVVQKHFKEREERTKINVVKLFEEMESVIDESTMDKTNLRICSAANHTSGVGYYHDIKITKHNIEVWKTIDFPWHKEGPNLMHKYDLTVPIPKESIKFCELMIVVSSNSTGVHVGGDHLAELLVDFLISFRSKKNVTSNLQKFRQRFLDLMSTESF